ncbi:MAG TPA: bacteriohemerythrin [Usitatibacteraceae bacterium]|nr:bacteriohemerythrin [Usitatibacteraceae bacterium]
MSQQEHRTAVPSGVADILQAFVQFPAPMALVNLEGTAVLVNAAFSSRFGEARVVPESLRELLRGEGGERRVALRSPGLEQAVEVRARAIPMPDRILLILDESGGPRRHDEMEGLRERVSQLERLAATDHLTGAWNRSHFDRLIDAEIARSTGSRQPVSLVLLDIDHFKRINDTFGHGMGDSVLRELVRLVQSRIRASDVLFRWGGEEFTVLVASAGYRGAERVAENLRAAVAGHEFRGVGTVTISLGVAEHAGGEDPQSWFRRLDETLYAAKNGGRNRVVVDRRGSSDAWAAEVGVSALHLEWQEAYECGDATIDGEHEQLFVLANRLIDAVARGEEEPATFREALDVLLAHVQRHFADEEAILARCHYADLEQHKAAHKGLLRRAGYLKERAEAGEASLGSVVEFLAQDVVARHLMTVDRAFFPLFDKRPPVPA